MGSVGHFSYAPRAQRTRAAYLHVVAPDVMDPASLDRAVAVEMRQRFDGSVVLNGGFDHERAEEAVRRIRPTSYPSDNRPRPLRLAPT